MNNQRSFPNSPSTINGDLSSSSTISPSTASIKNVFFSSSICKFTIGSIILASVTYISYQTIRRNHLKRCYKINRITNLENGQNDHQNSELNNSQREGSPQTQAVLLSKNLQQNEISRIKIGTRTSQLAMWQAKLVYKMLNDLAQNIGLNGKNKISGIDNTIIQHNGNDDQRISNSEIAHTSIDNFEIIGINTMGDIDQVKPLTSFDNKGVFTKELDASLLSGRIDLAVHCMKDLPTQLPDGLYLAAALERGDTDDALIVNEKYLKNHQSKSKLTLDDLPPNSVIGTSALRRSATIAHYHPHLKCLSIRGNVQTRLNKLDRGDFDAIILAKVGLQRLNLSSRITSILDYEKYGTAVGQGTLAIVCRENDEKIKNLCAKLNNFESRLRCECERSLLGKLQGGCKLPIAVKSNYNTKENTLSLWSRVLSLDGREHVENEQSIKLEEQISSSLICRTNSLFLNSALSAAVELGQNVGQHLLDNGAQSILEKIR